MQPKKRKIRTYRKAPKHNAELSPAIMFHKADYDHRVWTRLCFHAAMWFHTTIKTFAKQTWSHESIILIWFNFLNDATLLAQLRNLPVSHKPDFMLGDTVTHKNQQHMI